MVKRLLAPLIGLFLALGVIATAPAQATTKDPGSTVVPNSKWFSGTLLNLWGQNCSILGGAYSELMTSAIGMYGGDAAGGAPRVNQTYYAAILLSEPGNPCGVGSSVPEVRLRLPYNTRLAIDAAHPVRCFATRRFQDTYIDMTNAGNWSIPLSTGTITGPWCQAQPRPLGNGYYSIGTPAMANGTMHMIFVPIRSSGTLSGEALQWEAHDLSSYEGFALSESRVFVFDGATATPRFFQPQREAIPFWKDDADAGTENRVEFFANLYTADKAGSLCFTVRNKTDGNTLAWSCEMGQFNGTVTPGMGTVQVFGEGGAKGPNGGYAPFYFGSGQAGKQFTVQWTFTPQSGTPATTAPYTFRALSGRDQDGDGVEDAADGCPQTPGTGTDGCPPDLPADTDGDGLVGVADKCPTQDGKGSKDGCPPAPKPAKTLSLPKKLRSAKKVKSTTPTICTVRGKGAGAKVVVRKAGTCSLQGKKGKKTVRVKIRVK